MGVVAYDYFDRPDSALLGTSTSGHAWATGSTSTIGVSSEQAARSGALGPSLGVYHGAGTATNIANLTTFETNLGSSIFYAVDYLSPFSPDSSTNAANTDRWGVWKAGLAGRKLVFGINLVPEGGSFAIGNSGTYDADYTTLANLLVAEGLEDSILRLGWEANYPYVGPWDATFDPDGYISLYQRAHGIFSGVVGANFTFDWNAAIGPSGAIQSFEDFYPGGSYVDICGLSVYDRWFGAATVPTNEERWDYLETTDMGISDFITFAREQNKDISFPEWSLFPTTPEVFNGGGDNPDFIENMVRIFNENNPVYQAYPIEDHINVPDIFNVIDYGASGNGVNDDAPSIQAALDACAGTKGVVFFPSGKTFLCSTPKSADVLLYCQADTNIVATGATIKRGITRILISNWDVSSTSTSVYTGQSNIRIDGGTWDANAAATTANNISSWSHMENLVVQNATFKDTMRVHAMDIGGVKNANIYNCVFEGQFMDTTLDTSMYREAIQIDYCGTGNGHNAPADLTECQNITVERCTSTTTNTTAPAGYVAGPPAALVGQHAIQTGVALHTGIRIINNVIEDCRLTGIRIIGMSGPIIDGNIIRRSGDYDGGSSGYFSGISVEFIAPYPTNSSVQISNNLFGGLGIGTFIAGNDTASITVNTNNVAE